MTSVQLGGHYIAYTALPETAVVDADLPRSTVADESESQASTAAGSAPTEKSSGDSTTLALPRPQASRTTSFEASADPKQKASTSTRKWCYISDTVVKLTTLEEVMKSKAYICMYERI